MLDTSGSMALSEPGKPTRLQQAKDYLHSGGHAALAALAQHYQLKLYQFDETARAVPVERLEDLQAGGEVQTFSAHWPLSSKNSAVRSQ